MSDEFGEVKSFEAHLKDLKFSLKHSLIVFAVLTLFFFFISDHILTWMQQDIDIGLHGLSPFEVLNVRIGIAFIIGFIAALPSFIFSMINFAKPGLTKKEYRILKYSIPVSYTLFVTGSIFAYHIVFRNAVSFFIDFTIASGVEVVWGLSNTLMLGLRISLVTGFLFQLPLLVVILTKAGMVSIKQLRDYRPYVIVGVLTIAAFATPPDVLTQIMITAPIIILYELSIQIARLI